LVLLNLDLVIVRAPWHVQGLTTVAIDDLVSACRLIIN